MDSLNINDIYCRGKMDKEKILGFNIITYNEEKLLDNIFKDYKQNNQIFIVNVNPEIAINNYKNEEFKEILNEQKYQIPDGSGIVWASKRRKGNIKKRITGIDLMLKICEETQKYSSKIYLYGGKDKIAEKTKEELEKAYPKINIVGTCDGYCDETKAIHDIMKTEPDILFVGLGSPKQEEFIIKYRDKLKKVRILMPVGGSFDVISKSKKRAPKWMIQHNLEWLYRLAKEPRRALRQTKIIRYVIYIIIKKDERKEKKNEQN